jgi:hypothetical protein
MSLVTEGPQLAIAAVYRFGDSREISQQSLNEKAQRVEPPGKTFIDGTSRY